MSEMTIKATRSGRRMDVSVVREKEELGSGKFTFTMDRRITTVRINGVDADPAADQGIRLPEGMRTWSVA
jgi:hypothetical protein